MAVLVARRSLIVALVALAFFLALALGGRAAWRLVHRLSGPPPPPRLVDVSAIEGWMTVPYVGRAYRVPPPELYRALGVPPEGHRTSTLEDIARETGRDPAEVIQIVRDAVGAWRAANPPSGDGRQKPGVPKTERPPP